MSNATIDIHNTAGELIATVLITKDAERVEELMTADYAQLSWQSDSGTTLPAGAYIMFEGEKLSLLDPYEPEQKDELEYTYKPQFQSRVMGWGKVPFFHYTYGEGNVITAREPDWTLTDTPVNFMAAICKAIKNETGETWTYEVAEGLPASATLSFNASDILSGLNSIAGEFDTEWRADKATNTLILGKAQHSHTIGELLDEEGRPMYDEEDGSPLYGPIPVTLQVDSNVGVPSVTRSKEGYYNRFYVYGSTRNITQDYQGANVNNLVNKRLTLDPATYPNGYIDTERPAGTPIYPKILIFDDVYPHSGLTLANLRPRLMYRIGEDQKKVQVGTDANGEPVYDMYSIWYFQLPGFTLNHSTYSKDNPDGMLIAGKNLSVHFKSGALQGREFELIYHPKSETLRNSDGQDFEVLAGDYEIKFIEESGLIIPMQTGIVPADGDEVILFNIRMPQEYIATAYTELAQTALKEIEERYTADLNNYTVKSNPVAFAESDPGLSVGQMVLFVNGDYSYTTRVIKLVRKMDFTCEQEITIGNDKIKGNNATLKEEVVNANSNINILTQLNQLTQNVTQAYQRTQQMILDGLAGDANIFKRFDEMFEWGEREDGTKYIHGKKGIAADWLSAPGAFIGNTGAGAGGASRLVDLTDVAVSTLRSGDAIVWNGSKWVNTKIEAGLDSSALATYLTTNGYLTSADLGDYATRSWVMGQGYLTEHQDLSGLLTRTELEAMFEWVTKADGTRYIKAKAGVAATWLSAPGEFDGTPDPIVAVNKLSQLTGDVKLSGLTAGQSLVWNGAFWVNRAINAGLDESALASYLTSHNYVTSSALDGYVPLSDVYGGSELFGKIPKVGGNGVMEVGKYLDFHNSSDTGIKDYDARLSVESNNMFYRTGNLILDAGNYTSVLDGRYVNAAGDTMTGPLNFANNTWNNVGDDASIGDCNRAGCVGIKGLNGVPGILFYKSDGTVAGNMTTDGNLLWNSNKVWHAGNDGSGSGLDADLLDGLHLGDIRVAGYAMQETTIDASGLDQNTWYPVTMWLGCDKRYRIEVFEALSGRSHPAWAQHYNGFSVQVIWTAIGNGWGTMPMSRYVHESISAFCDTSPVRGVGQMYNSSCEFVYVRGGGIYTFRTSHGLVPTLATSAVTVNGESIAPTTTMPAAINRSYATLGDNVASATKLQTARNIFGNMFDGTNDVLGAFLWNNGDATLRIYDIASTINSGYGNETIGIQSYFDGQDPLTSSYVTSFGNRCLIALQPRGGHVSIGRSSAARYKLDVTDGDIIADGWIRTTGARGWYSETYGGGWYMTDSVWIRAFNGKSIYTPANMQVDGTISNGAGIWSSQYVSAKGNAGSSDIRLKTNLKPFALELRDIAGAPLATFDWKDGSGRDIGSIAQYWLSRCPLAVLTDPEGYYSLDYGKLATAMGISLAGVVENHEERLTKLERRLTDECK